MVLDVFARVRNKLGVDLGSAGQDVRDVDNLMMFHCPQGFCVKQKVEDPATSCANTQRFHTTCCLTIIWKTFNILTTCLTLLDEIDAAELGKRLLEWRIRSQGEANADDVRGPDDETVLLNVEGPLVQPEPIDRRWPSIDSTVKATAEGKAAP